MYGNGGQLIAEIAAQGMMMQGQIAADRQVLMDFEANLNTAPDVDNMVGLYRSIMEAAYRAGEKLALVET